MDCGQLCLESAEVHPLTRGEGGDAPEEEHDSGDEDEVGGFEDGEGGHEVSWTGSALGFKRAEACRDRLVRTLAPPLGGQIQLVGRDSVEPLQSLKFSDSSLEPKPGLKLES